MTVTLKLFPPYSAIAGRREIQIPLPGARPVPAPEFFRQVCEDYPALRELFFPSGSLQDFPGYTSVLRDGISIGAKDVIRPGDVLEILTALSGG